MIETGKVYKAFTCGHFFPAETPTRRIHNVNIKLASGNYKWTIVCPECQRLDAGYQYRFKICPECGELRWAKFGNMRPGRCKVCGAAAHAHAREPVKRPLRRYFQAGREIPAPKRPWTNPDCMHRDGCLVAACVTHDSFLHCRGCGMYQQIEKDYTAVILRDDPYIYAEVG